MIPIAGPRENIELLRASYDTIDEALNNGELVCIFPEGTLTPDGDIHRFKNGMEKMVAIVKAIRSANADIPILVHGNAGMPKNVAGKVVFPESPEEMAAIVVAVIEAGANIVGGCCGTTPKHIEAMVAGVAS